MFSPPNLRLKITTLIFPKKILGTKPAQNSWQRRCRAGTTRTCRDSCRVLAQLQFIHFFLAHLAHVYDAGQHIRGR